MKNKSKLVQRTIKARRNVRNLAITSLPGDQCTIVNINSYNIPSMSASQAQVMMHDFTQVKHNWSVLLCVFGASPHEGAYWKTLDVSPSNKIYASQMEAALRAKHEELFNGFNMEHFVSIGWIAKPTTALFDNDAVYKLFDKLGAWNYTAPWERIL